MRMGENDKVASLGIMPEQGAPEEEEE
jgi:hypothetical protein